MHQSLQYAREHNGELSDDHPRGEDSNTHDGSMTVSDEFLSHLQEMIPRDIDSKFRLVLVDGILLFWDPLIYKQFDCSFFIHAGKDTLKQRRESRQGYVTQEGRGSWKSGFGAMNEHLTCFLQVTGLIHRDILISWSGHNTRNGILISSQMQATTNRSKIAFMTC